MKSDNSGISALIKKEDLEALLKETKETVATYVQQDDAGRTFGAIDMWNRQKKQRTTLQMRRWMN